LIGRQKEEDEGSVVCFQLITDQVIEDQRMSEGRKRDAKRRPGRKEEIRRKGGEAHRFGLIHGRGREEKK